MSAGVGSYATTATVYGRNAADSYYNLSAPGLINGPLEVTGNLKVDGTTQLVGPVQMDASATITGSLTCASNIVASANLLVNQGIYGANTTTAPVFPRGLFTQAPVTLGSSSQATQSGLQVFGNAVVAPSAAGGGVMSANDFNGNNSADGFRAVFSKGLTAAGVTIGGTGTVAGSALVIGDSTTPGGSILGYNGSAIVGPVNFPNGLASPSFVSALDSTKVQSGYGQAQAFNWLVNGVPVPINCASFVGGQTITVTVPADIRTNLAYAGKQIVKFAMSTAAVNCTLIVTDGTNQYVNIAFSTNPVFYPLLYQVDLLQNAVVGGPNAILSTGVQNGGGVYFTQN